MSTTYQPLQRPGRGVARLVGAALAVLLVLLATRLPWTAPSSAPLPQPDTLDAAPAPALDAPALDAPGTLGLLPPAERVAFWEGRVAAGGSYLDLINLADAYLDHARASGALDDLTRAAAALDRAAKTAPYPAQVQVRRAQVAFALHDFRGAQHRADMLLQDDPQNLAALGVAADARLEMGDVDGAHQRYQQLEQLAPSPASWSRLARIQFLTGHPDPAMRLVSRAVAVSLQEGFPDAEAFYAFQLGDMRRATGDLAGAADSYLESLSALPDYVPAMAGLAGVRQAQGRRDDAINLLETATARLPQPELVAALGDLYSLSGEPERAEAQYRLVDGIARLEKATGSVYNRQLVLFAADHDRGVAQAVRSARVELAVRGDIYGHDALAWALYKAGRVEEAAVEANAAMALGTPDPRIAYHAGMIALARHEPAAARPLLVVAVRGGALLPPLQLDRARAALMGLGSSS